MKSLCINRINKDIREIIKSPLEGIGIVALNDDPMKYIVNIRIMTGIYEGYCLQLLLTFFDNYPIRPPKILIFPGQALDNSYHHHIFKDKLLDEKGRNFYKFCLDLLDNDFMLTSSEHTGWNPSYTISSLLLQVQTFLSQPDLSVNHLPNQEKIQELMKSMEEYENTFKIKDDNGDEIIKIHTWKNPYPEIFSKKEKIENNEEDKIKNKLKEDLTCFISRLNYIDDKNILLGYPIRKEKEKFIPIPEILSYDCFIEEESLKGIYNNRFDNNLLWVLEDDNNHNFDNNNIVNNIVEIHNINNNENNINGENDNLGNINNNNGANNNINENNINNNVNNNNNNVVINFEEHFLNWRLLENRNQHKNEFKSANNELYNTWLPIYIDENHFKKNEATILNYFSILKYGNSGLEKYDFHPKYIFEIMPNIFTEMILKTEYGGISSSFLKCFFQYTLLYKRIKEKYKNNLIKYQKYYLKKIIKETSKINKIIDVIKQIFLLFILFFFDGNEINHEIKGLLKKHIKQLKNLFCFLKFEQNKDFNFKNKYLFINNLKKHGLFYKIVDIIFTDNKALYYLGIRFMERGDIIKKMNNNFKGLYNSLNDKTKQKVKKIIMLKLDFSDFFNLKMFDKVFSIYDYKILNIKNYELLLLFFNLRKEIIRKEFFDELEKNYGICLNAENIIEDFKKNINNYEYLKNYIEIFSKYKYLNKIKDLILLCVYEKKKNISRFSSIYHIHHDNDFDDNYFCYVYNRFLPDFPYDLRQSRRSILRRFNKAVLKNSIKSSNNLIALKKNYKKRVFRDILKRERRIIKINCNKIHNKGLKR